MLPAKLFKLIPAESNTTCVSYGARELLNEPVISLTCEEPLTVPAGKSLGDIVIAPLNVALPLASKVIPSETEPICIPLEFIESLTVEPSFNSNPESVILTCSVDVLPIVVTPANLANSTLPDTSCTPSL